MKTHILLALCLIPFGCSESETPGATDTTETDITLLLDTAQTETDILETPDVDMPDSTDTHVEAEDVIPAEDVEEIDDTWVEVDEDTAADVEEPAEDIVENPPLDVTEEVDTTENIIPTDEETGYMVPVPEGMFLMGCDVCDPDEAPRHPVTLSAYEIDKTEVTQSAYQACVDAGPCSSPSDNFYPVERPTHPVTNVSWGQARTFCLWANKRLPTEAEWEKAARGPDGQTYPWGEDAPDCTLAHTSECTSESDGPLPVGSLPDGGSPYGAVDMSGNVWEWTHDYYAADAYLFHDGPDPQGPEEGTERVYRGGSAGNAASLATTTNRASTYNPEVGGSGLGFRCAR